MINDELIERILNRTKILFSQMENIFKENEVPHLDFNKLPATGRHKWIKLYKRSNRLNDLICHAGREK